MKMFKVMMAASWKDRNGNVRPYVKYMKANTIEEVIKHFGTDNIFLVGEC
jgi:hypothetical protein